MPVNDAKRRFLPTRVASVAFALLGLAAVPRAALADEAEPAEFEVPPDPRHRPPVLAGQVHLDFGVALTSADLCPQGGECIYGRSAGLGGILERRWQSGIALGLTYSTWFTDGKGVYEISVLQALGVHLRVLLLRERSVHPFFGGAAGAVLFGETFRVATSGIFLDGVVGAEVEATESVALTLGLRVRTFATRRFTTPDGVLRAAGTSVNATLAAEIGLVLLRR